MSTMTTTDTATQSAPGRTDTPPRAAARKTSFMSKAWVIGRRELLSYFVSPIAYVAIVVFLVASGMAFAQDFEGGRPAMMRHVFEWMLWFLAFVVPILCMGSISQEWSNGTIETLMTAPVSDTEVVLGKFIGAFSFVLVLLAPTLLYAIVLAAYATPSLDFGPVVCGYIGMILAAALFVAVSLFCSSLTRSQVVAAVSAFAILGAITIVPWLVASSVSLPGFWRWTVNQMVYARYADFSKGVLDSGHVVYFLVNAAIFLFFTVKVLEFRRWK
jgi:ABC-2 type transport system permease protein